MAPLQRTNQPGDMVTSRQIRSAILPWEKQLIDTLGLTIEEYNWYANEVANHRPERDAAYDHVPHVVCDPITVGIVTTVVGAGLSFAAQALAPKPKLPRQSDPGQEQSEGRQITGASVNADNRFTNVDGFTSVQPLARLGEVMPLVFANRQEFYGKYYGGVRVETKLIWSQLLSQGDGQELLALFLASAGQLAAASTPEFKGFAIGDSLLRGYQENKFAVYFQRGQPGEGRITTADKIAGGLSARGQDVFQAELGNEGLKPLFSGVRIPTTMTQFGTSEPLRNGQTWRLPYKRVRVVVPTQVYTGTLDLASINRQIEIWTKENQTVALAKLEKAKIESAYACRTGIIRVNGSGANGDFEDRVVSPGSIVEFLISGSSYNGDWGQFGTQDIQAKDDNYRQSCDDVLIVGETYLISGAEAVCTGSSPQSQLWTPGSGDKIYFFKVLIEGRVRIVSESLINSGRNVNPTQGPTISKLTIANITTTRKLNQVEIGIKSQVWKRFTGMANFAGRPNEQALQEIERGGNTFNIGSYNEYGLRYSIFRLQIREKGTDNWITLDPQTGAPFCVKGRTPIDQFNFIRIKFADSTKQYEIRLRPLSGGGFLTNGLPSGNALCVLDARSGEMQTHTVNNFTISYLGFREKLTVENSTNNVFFVGGKAAIGNVESLNSSQYSTDGFMGVTTLNTTTLSGSGSGLTVRVYANASETEAPIGAVITGMSTRWLHMDVLGAPYPGGLGQTYTADATFYHPTAREYEESSNSFGGRMFIRVRMTLRTEPVDDFGQGYTGYPYMWRNSNLAGTIVTIVDSSRTLISGAYELNKPSNSETPPNGTVKASINVTAGASIWLAQLQVVNGGSGYKPGDAVQAVGSPVTLPVLRVGSIRSFADVANEEQFDAVGDVYYHDQQEGSHQNGPEHQIVYVNEQRENFKSGANNPERFTPQYDRMAMIGLQLRSGKEWSDFSNLTYYAKQGRETVRMIDPVAGTTTGYSPTSGIIGPTHLFPEILRALLRSPLVGANKLIPESMIDWPGFQEACKVCIANQWFWDGVLASPVNIREWAYENAAYFFLDFLVLGGKLSLQPTFPVSPTQGLQGYTLSGAYDRLPTISALFTDGNIIEDSLEVSWYPAEQRLAPQVLITLRDEVEDGFAETRNILVRLAESQQTDSESAPVEAVDFTGFCTSADHAVDFAKLLIQTRRYVTHTVTFKTFPEGLALAPGAYFKLASQARHVDQFQNGYVLDDGRVVTSSELTGSNTVYWWRSGMLAVETGTMTIDGNGYVTDNKFAGAVFTVYANAQSARVYKAELISYDEEGMVEITGSHVPQEPSGKITYLNLAESLFEVQNEQ